MVNISLLQIDDESSIAQDISILEKGINLEHARKYRSSITCALTMFFLWAYVINSYCSFYLPSCHPFKHFDNDQNKQFNHSHLT